MFLSEPFSQFWNKMLFVCLHWDSFTPLQQKSMCSHTVWPPAHSCSHTLTQRNHGATSIFYVQSVVKVSVFHRSESVLQESHWAAPLCSALLHQFKLLSQRSQFTSAAQAWKNVAKLRHTANCDWTPSKSLQFSNCLLFLFFLRSQADHQFYKWMFH